MFSRSRRVVGSASSPMRFLFGQKSSHSPIIPPQHHASTWIVASFASMTSPTVAWSIVAQRIRSAALLLSNGGEGGGTNGGDASGSTPGAGTPPSSTPIVPPPLPSVTPPPAVAASNSLQSTVGIPKGFARYFHSSFPRAGDTTAEIANKVSVNEQRLIQWHNQRVQVARRKLHRRLLLTVVLGTIVLVRYVYSSPTFNTAEEGASIIAAAQRVVIDLDSKGAKFYDGGGHLIGVQHFMSDSALRASVVAERTKAGIDGVLDFVYSVPIHYPLMAIAALWFLPLIAGFHSTVIQSTTGGREAAVKQVASRFRFKEEHNVKVKLVDVAGLTEVKREVIEVIDFLKEPTKYRSLGAKLPKGILLDGPPGVGKTLLAKAIAGEAKLPFVSCSGSEFEEVYVGVGAMRVRELFKEARKMRPCVVFIDEIDTFGRKRRTDRNGNSRGTINAFLSELDGFGDASGIMVLAATNRADILDEALTRAGRFDRKISFEKPPLKDRIAIAQVHLKKIVLDPALPISVTSEALASLTPGCTGADIFNICNEAAIIATRQGRDSVNMACFHAAIDRVLVGMEKKAKKIMDREKERIAYHEAGHVVLNWFQETTDPVLKATISSRGGKQLGQTQKLPQDVYIRTQTALHEAMVAALGGYVVEEHFFEDISSSAAEDLRRVTEMAWHEICTYGMDPVNVGHFGYQADERDGSVPYGEEKANAIDASVKRLVEMATEKARELLRARLLEVRTVAGLLIRQETLTAQELWVLLGERPKMTGEFRRYLESP